MFILQDHYFVNRFAGVPTSIPGEVVACNFFTRLPRESSGIPFDRYAGFTVLHGEGRYVDWNGQEYHLKPGTMAQHLPGKVHKIYRDSKSWLQVGIVLPTSWHTTYCQMGLLDATRPVIDLNLTTDLVDRFWELHCTIQANSTETLPQWLINLQSLLMDLRTAAKPDNKPERDMALIHECCARLFREHALSPQDLARSIGMSYSHFRRRFRELVGQSPKAYADQCRLEQAKAMLTHTDLTIREIADSLNFYDQYAFSKSFKKHTSISPTSFRQSASQSPQEVDHIC